MRTLILGATGNFGARIHRALAQDPAFEIIAASRRGPARLDLASPDFAAGLRALKPQLVIHCAGPYQGQDYRVAQASIASGAHYLDLADGRDFVARFAAHNDAAARAANVFATSGASTLPALSSAVMDSFASRLRTIEEIRIVIAPGQRAPRGAATIAGVFSYAGRPVRRLRDGAWGTVSDWQDLRRVRIAAVGTRFSAVCDVPDLELFPARYRGVRTVEFRAALEFAIEHAALWLAALLRRAHLPLPIERWAAPLGRTASLLDRFGGERGGMLVSVTGVKVDGGRARIEWHLSTEALNGPEIPCMAAILLARKLARNEIAARGAYACMGFLQLAEFAPEFARWGMETRIEETAL